MEHWSQEKKLWVRFLLRISLIITVVATLILGIRPFISLISPFVLAFWVACGLNPTITELEQRLSWKRAMIVLWLLLLIGFGVVSLFWLIIPAFVRELKDLGENWEPLLESAVVIFQDLEGMLRDFFQREDGFILQDTMDKGVEALKGWVSNLVSAMFLALGDWAVKVPGYCVAFLVFLLASYFYLSDFPLYQEKLEQYSTKQSRFWVEELKDSALEAFWGYIKAQVILTLGVCLIMLVGFFLMELPFALVLAGSIALLDFIPMIGAGVVLIPWAVVAFLTGYQQVAWQLMVICVLGSLFRRLLEPKILGHQTGLSPLLSLVGVYIGLQIGGIWGMIFTPVALLMGIHFIRLGIFSGFVADGKGCLASLRGIYEENE